MLQIKLFLSFLTQIEDPIQFYFKRSIIYNWEILYGNGTKVPGVTGTTDGFVTSTGWNKQNLVINAGQLQDSVNFKVILKAKYGEAGKNTIITLERNTASLPHSGTCEI